MYDMKLGKWVDIAPEATIVDTEERFVDTMPVEPRLMVNVTKPLPTNDLDRKRYLLSLAGIIEQDD